MKKSSNETTKKLGMISLMMSLVSKQNNSLLEKNIKNKIYVLGVGSTLFLIFKLVRSAKYRKTAKRMFMILFNSGLISSSLLFMIYLLFVSKKTPQRKSSNSIRN